MAKDIGLGGIGGGVIGGMLSRAFLGNGFGNDGFNNHNNQSSERAAIDAAVAAALASANQNNNNSMLLLKDIQDSSQEVISAVNAGVNAATGATLQAEIANLQGQGVLGAAIQDSKYTTTNEIHEAATDVIASTTANTSQLAATMNTLGASLAAGHAELNAAIQQAKYDNTIATMNDGDKTRAAVLSSERVINAEISDLKNYIAENIPNKDLVQAYTKIAELEGNARHGRTADVFRSGNVEVTNNINNTASANALAVQLNRIETRQAVQEHNQNAMATAINVGGYQRATQTPTNISQ